MMVQLQKNEVLEPMTLRVKGVFSIEVKRSSDNQGWIIDVWDDEQEILFNSITLWNDDIEEAV